jgi:hypothetical protein
VVSPIFLSAVEAHWIEQNIQPNVYAVATLKQSIVVENGALKIFVKGDREKYDLAAACTLNNLSRKIYKNAYRRSGKIVPVATTFEGDGQIIRYHLNFLLSKPKWMPFDIFEKLFREEWSKNAWARPIAYFRERTGNCVLYSLKEGPEALLPYSTRF